MKTYKDVLNSYNKLHITFKIISVIDKMIADTNESDRPALYNAIEEFAKWWLSSTEEEKKEY